MFPLFLFFFYKDKLFRETNTGHSPSSQVIQYTVGKNRTSTSVRCGEVVSQSLRIRPNIFYSFGSITINFSFIAKTEPWGGRGGGGEATSHIFPKLDLKIQKPILYPHAEAIVSVSGLLPHSHVPEAREYSCSTVKEWSLIIGGGGGGRATMFGGRAIIF